jgi:hypothetical protein
MVNDTSQTNWNLTFYATRLYNKQLFHERVVVENSFNILKKIFKELLIKSNLNVLFLLDVVVCCCMFHNLILNGKDIGIDELMFRLEAKDILKIDRKGVRRRDFD